jgi:hypothetical protein
VSFGNRRKYYHAPHLQSGNTNDRQTQECSNKEEVKTIEAMDESEAVTYPGSAAFFAAPWLVDTIVNPGTSKPSKIIPIVNAAAIKFHAEHDNDKEYNTTAADHSRDFILWAWGVKADQVLATRLTIDPNNTDLEHFKIKCHQSCITKPFNNIPDGLPPPSHRRPSKRSSVRTSKLNISTSIRQTRNAELQTVW